MKFTDLFMGAFHALEGAVASAASHPATDTAVATALTSGLTDLKALVEAPIEKAVDSEVEKIPFVGPELVLLLNGLIDQAITAAQTQADAKIAQLTALKSALPAA